MSLSNYIFLSKYERKTEVELLGAMQQTRAIFSLKMCLLQFQFKKGVKDKRALQDIYLFLVKAYMKPWFGNGFVLKVTNQDLLSRKFQVEIDKLISKTALGKFLPTIMVFI